MHVNTAKPLKDSMCNVCKHWSVQTSTHTHTHTYTHPTHHPPPHTHTHTPHTPLNPPTHTHTHSLNIEGLLGLSFECIADHNLTAFLKPYP